MKNGIELSIEEAEKMHEKDETAWIFWIWLRFGIQRVIERLEKLQQDDGWISVEERLPEEWQLILCYEDSKRGKHIWVFSSVAQFTVNKWLLCIYNLDDLQWLWAIIATQWQPLPTPPITNP